jgi:cell division septation protein DedD
MKKNKYNNFLQGLLIGFVALSVCACASDLQTKVAGNLMTLSKNQTVAILPIETSDAGQKEMAEMFRLGLYANLKQSKFQLLERYVVDGLLQQNKLTDPSNYLTINPMQFGEILGVDAIVFSRINKVERSYLIVHSSIELSVSVQMVDTRSGEILWRAEQTEQDFSGIGKIPTGITTAILAPIQFVTNKFNLRRMTSNMVDKLTALIKHPNEASEESQFEEPVIAKNATNDLKKIGELQQLKAEWQHALVLDEESELSDFGMEAPEVAAIPASLPVEQNINNIPVPVKETKRVESEMSPLPGKNKIKRSQSVEPIPMNSLRATIAEPKVVIEYKEKEALRTPQPKSAARQPESKKPLLYTIQVGAYKTKAYAKKLENSLKKKGYDAFVTRNAKKIYRVQVDRFDSKEEAVKLAQRIQTVENLKNFVTRFSGV